MDSQPYLKYIINLVQAIQFWGFMDGSNLVQNQ